MSYNSANLKIIPKEDLLHWIIPKEDKLKYKEHVVEYVWWQQCVNNDVVIFFINFNKKGNE